MHRAFAAQPDVFCAYYEPMAGVAPALLARPSAASFKRMYTRSTSALRTCFSYFR